MPKYLIRKPCPQCGKQFQPINRYIQCCSLSCAKRLRGEPSVSVVCQVCGVAIQKHAGDIRRGSGVFFCSRSCYYAAHPPAPVEKRFWSKVDKSGECWLWTASTDRKGYGTFTFGNTRGKAHRVSWELANGPIPKGLCVLHNCPGGQDNPRCVNPAHLWLGTNTENVADMVKKGRQHKGERSPSAKLTEAAVLIIRSSYANGGISYAKLAVEFGVAVETIRPIVLRKTWKHI